MLLPKKTKYRKVRKGKNDGVATRGHYVAFGDFGLQAQGNNDITSRQIESARQAMTRYIKRGGKIWIRIFPHKPITARPPETRMGKGKGPVDAWVAVVRPGTMMFEISGVPESAAKEALRLASNKLGIRCRFVTRGEQ